MSEGPTAIQRLEQTMKQCWKSDPLALPSFSKVSTQLPTKENVSQETPLTTHTQTHTSPVQSDFLLIYTM